MIEKEITVNIEGGLEARPVAELVQTAGKFKSNIYVHYQNKKVNAKSIMGMMSLGLAKGEKILISADGPDEDDAVCDMEKYLVAR